MKLFNGGNQAENSCLRAPRDDVTCIGKHDRSLSARPNLCTWKREKKKRKSLRSRRMLSYHPENYYDGSLSIAGRYKEGIPSRPRSLRERDPPRQKNQAGKSSREPTSSKDSKFIGQRRRSKKKKGENRREVEVRGRNRKGILSQEKK